jgi:hypothetical protein
MKSPEVYSTLKQHLAPAFKAAGFKRTATLLSWVRPQGALFVAVWCQVSRDGWDGYAGSKFTVEFQLSEEPLVGARAIRRQRIASMLDGDGREEIRRIQNHVIASLRHPPTNYPKLQISKEVSEWYWGAFQRVREPYGDQDDVWLQYSSEDQVATWAKFVSGKLPECLRQIEKCA